MGAPSNSYALTPTVQALVPPDDAMIESVLERMKQRESHGDQNAKGKKGEVGLFQIMPQTGDLYHVSPELLTNPVINKWVAKRYLTDLLKQFNGDMTLAVAAYNAGPGRVAKGEIPSSTKAYVRDVLGPDAMPMPGATPTTVASKGPSSAIGPTLQAQPLPTVPLSTATPSATPSAKPTSGIAPNTLEIPSVGPVASSAQPTIVSQANMTPSVSAAPTDILSRLLNGGIGTAAAEAVPIPTGASVGAPIPPGASIGKPMPIPPGSRVGSAKAEPLGPPESAAYEPLGLKAAEWLPTVGQFGGEIAGASAGAMVPGANLSGVPEYAGAVAGGGAGSAAGAYLNNKIREAYGYHPNMSLVNQGLLGAGGSAIGGLFPLVGRFRKASKIAEATGKSFKQALEEVTQMEAALEGTVGMGARKAKMLENASSFEAQRAYSVARDRIRKQLGDAYDAILKPFYNRMTPQTAIDTVRGAAGKKLELVGKPMRQELEHEFTAHPMTVRRVQRLIGLVKDRQRALNKDTQRIAIQAYQDIIDALERDRDAVIGQGAAQAVKTVDGYYYQFAKRFPLGPISKADMLPEAADAILKHKPGAVGRVLEMLKDVKAAGKIDSLRRALAARIFQKAGVESAATPLARIESLGKAVKTIEPEIFDSLYGAGSRKAWLDLIATLGKRDAELLKNPNEAAAIATEVRKYLSEPGMLGKMSNFFQHHALWSAMGIAGAYGAGGVHGLVAAGVGLLGIEGFEMVSHSRVAMKMLEKAATEKNAKVAARLIVSALGAAIRTGGESALGSDQPESATGAP